jgi:hypothetical protein
MKTLALHGQQEVMTSNAMSSTTYTNKNNPMKSLQ